MLGRTNLFLAIITPFIYPFEFSRDDLAKQMGLVDGKLHQLALLLTDETHGLKFNTHPNSLYMHLLAFYFKDIQTLQKTDRTLSCFSMQECELGNKTKKEDWVSLFSFNNRPVGNSKNPGTAWKNNNFKGFLMHKSRISQLYYPFWIGRLRSPYKCSACKEYGHNSGSSLCPGPITLFPINVEFDDEHDSEM